MQTFYFNTGVRAYTVPNFPFEYHKEQGNVIQGGVLQIPFDVAGIPPRSILHHISDTPDIENYNVSEIYNSTIIGKYAHFIRKD